MAQQISYLPFIFGGLFIGIWAMGWLFGYGDLSTVDPTRWLIWGLVGILLGGSLFSMKFLQDIRGKIAVVTGIAIIVGILVTAWIVNTEAYVFATLITTVGVAMIAAAFPVTKPQPVASAATPKKAG